MVAVAIEEMQEIENEQLRQRIKQAGKSNTKVRAIWRRIKNNNNRQRRGSVIKQRRKVML
jgi:hypothetical protein